MSEVRSSRIKSTDFSIARILTNDPSKFTSSVQYSSSINFTYTTVVSQQNTQDVGKGRKVITKQHDFSVQTLNQKKVAPKYEEKKDLIEKYVSCITPRKMCQDSFVIGEQNNDNERSVRRSDLTWLQYTRYRPPKLPRKSFIERHTKRRVGDNPRIPFSSTQLQILENRYKKDAYLSKNDVVEMSRILRLPQNKVRARKNVLFEKAIIVTY